MAEFPTQTGLEANLILQREHPPFVRNLSGALSLTQAQQAEIANVQPGLWLPWTTAVFGGDERTALVQADHRSITGLSDKASPLMGCVVTLDNGQQVFDFRQGDLAQRLRGLHAKNNPGSRTRLEKASVASARFMSAIGLLARYNTEQWRDFVPTVPQANIKPDMQGVVHIEFIDSPQKYPVDGPARSIVTYGPGMSGSYLTGDMMGRTKEAHYVSGGVGAFFMREWISGLLAVAGAGVESYRRQGTLGRYVRLGVRLEDVRPPEAHFYNDGIADAVGCIANKTMDKGSPVDVVFMSAVHSAGAEECLAGTHGAHRLLRDGGLFVVKAPRVSIGGEGGLDVVAPVAYQLFGGPAVAGECGYLAQYTDPSLPRERPADFAIYKK